MPGLYAALLDRERMRFARTPVDPRWRFTERGQVAEPAPDEWQVSRTDLDALEAGEPVMRQGRSLKFLLPEHRRRREDALKWFKVTADDLVVPVVAPD